jgi:hypothetical protein
MKMAENLNSLVKPVRRPGEAVLVSSSQSYSDNGTLNSGSEQPDDNQGEHLYGFFAIGVTINIVMIVAYIIWAYRQWHKKGKGS